jgi:hypothetical protein
MNTKYNGWTNYETWNYKLWMDNDAGSYEYYRELAAELASDPEIEASDVLTPIENHRYHLAESLKEQCEYQLEEWMPSQSGPFSDILNAGISQINWDEIAKSILDDIEEAA